MKVQFVKDYDGDRYTSGVEYLEGDVITIADANGKQLVDLGICVKVADDPAPAPRVVKPKLVVDYEKPKAGKK